MPASFASMDRESENHGLVNPRRFSALENRSKALQSCGFCGSRNSLMTSLEKGSADHESLAAPDSAGLDWSSF